MVGVAAAAGSVEWGVSVGMPALMAAAASRTMEAMAGREETGVTEEAVAPAAAEAAGQQSESWRTQLVPRR